MFVCEINAWFNLVEFLYDLRNITFFGINDSNVFDISKVLDIICYDVF